jgi:hypothetical protein
MNTNNPFNFVNKFRNKDATYTAKLGTSSTICTANDDNDLSFVAKTKPRLK